MADGSTIIILKMMNRPIEDDLIRPALRWLVLRSTLSSARVVVCKGVPWSLLSVSSWPGGYYQHYNKVDYIVIGGLARRECLPCKLLSGLSIQSSLG